MGVFTTRTLLSSVGVSQSKSTPGAIAINWILKVNKSCLLKNLFVLVTFLSNLFDSFEEKITNLLEGFVLYWSSRIDKHKLHEPLIFLELSAI